MIQARQAKELCTEAATKDKDAHAFRYESWAQAKKIFWEEQERANMDRMRTDPEGEK